MLDALEADLESMLAAPGVVANPTDFVVMAFEDVRMNSREIIDAFVSLDAVELKIVFSRRAVLMKTVWCVTPCASPWRKPRKRVDAKMVGNYSCFFPRCCCTDHRGKGTSRTSWSAGSTTSRCVVGMF